MSATKYFVKNDGDSVLISVPVTNNTSAKKTGVSVVFGAFDGNITLTNNYKDVGTYTALTRTWDGFDLAPGETQVIYLKFTVADVYLTPVTITGTITNAVDGNDSSGTSISITIENEDKTDDYVSYTALLTQTGTNAPTAVGMTNTIGSTYTLARTTDGVYTITADDTPFTTGKTAIFVSSNGASSVGRIVAAHTSTSVITISTYNESFVLDDDLLNSTAIEIRVYGTPVLV